MKTGAIQAGIARLVNKLRGHERWMIPILMTIFAIGGTTFGMAEESLAFYVLIITVMIAAGYDALTGASVILLGAGIGVLGSTINPFATGIASDFADVPLSEGLGLRVVIVVVGLAIGIGFVLRYAERVRRDPTKSLVYAMKAENDAHFSAPAGDGVTDVELTGRHKLVLTVFGLAFLVMIYGVIPWDDIGIHITTLWWWFPEMTASFLLFGIIIGLIGGMREGELTSTFVDGARDLLGVALIIGIARGITVIMNNGQITDTVLHWAESALGDVRAAPFAVVMPGRLIGELAALKAGLHGPAGETAGDLLDVALRVAAVDAQGVQFQQFARIVLVGDSSAVAPAVHGVEINDHRRTFGADAQQIVECALRIEEGLTPALVLLELQLRRQQSALRAVVVDVKIIARFGVLCDKMVFQKLVQHLQQLAF